MLEIDRPERTLKELMAHSPSPLHRRILNGIEAVFIFAMVKLFGRCAYQKKYLSGRWFQYFYSPGWRWAFNGMFAKLFTGAGRGIPWPVSSQGSFGKGVEFDVDDLNNFQVSSFFQTFGEARIAIGKGSLIARGAALVTTNHDPENPAMHLPPQDIVIGERCWLGANVAVMPGVVLGPGTVVGANAVVTKSFPDGHCLIAGAPARKIKDYPIRIGQSDS